ncbi:hypothetical protein DPMN_084513 [Dreissena polymorpha]|uniref:Uncharacterized protein n=1 Tax=Dreissena polymorpha TaxID=45954 RepID=A0A9D4BKY5_DREPO|nr:hypothetical protein DPMN_084513 [Dreissena polymorpha]
MKRGKLEPELLLMRPIDRKVQGTSTYYSSGIVMKRDFFELELLKKRNVFQQTETSFVNIQDIIKRNILTKFQGDWTINVTLRVQCFSTNRNHIRTRPRYNFDQVSCRSDNECFTTVLKTHNWKNATPSGGHFFQPTGTIFKLIKDSIWTNLLTKFHEDRTINVAISVSTSPPPGGHSKISFAPNRLTTFHEDRTINATSSVLTRQMLTPHNRQKAITEAHHGRIMFCM